MKKSELIAILNSVEGDPEIILSTDAEGNDFSPLDSWHKDEYIPYSEYNGGLAPLGYIGEDAVPAIVLWPTN